VRNDGESLRFFDFDPEQQAIFSAGVEAATTGGALALAATYDFARHRRLLDVGGGTGSFLRAIGRQHPHLQLTLFELPKTAAYARSRLAPQDRLEIVEGDMLNDALPAGHDATILAHVVHGFRERQHQQLLERVYAAAPAGGRLLIVDFFLDESRTDPVMATLMSGEFLVNTGARSYSVAEIRAEAAETGWRFVAHQPLGGPVSVVTLERP
jgi:precorrin-6B methylase 2